MKKTYLELYKTKQMRKTHSTVMPIGIDEMKLFDWMTKNDIESNSAGIFKVAELFGFETEGVPLKQLLVQLMQDGYIPKTINIRGVLKNNEFDMKQLMVNLMYTDMYGPRISKKRRDKWFTSLCIDPNDSFESILLRIYTVFNCNEYCGFSAIPFTEENIEDQIEFWVLSLIRQSILPDDFNSLIGDLRSRDITAIDRLYDAVISKYESENSALEVLKQRDE